MDTETTVIDKELAIIPKPIDDDKNLYHDKTELFKVEVEEEISSDEPQDEEASASQIPMGPMKPIQP